MSPDSIIADPIPTFRRTTLPAVALLLLLQLNLIVCLAQRVAVITPDNSPRSVGYAGEVAARFNGKIRILDNGLTSAAFKSLAIPTPFNMTIDEAKTTASVVGCDYFIVVRSDGNRRTSLAQGEYFEAFAFLYLVDGRTGSLITWKRLSFEGSSQAHADEALVNSASPTAMGLSNSITEFAARSASSEKPPSIEEVPPDGSPAATGLKPPIPYKRIKPEYPSIAFLYDAKATIDAETDIGANGEVLAIRIVRWAGFELEAAVEKAVREMNWRPAMRDGKALPMRILLRYNFTKVDKDK